MSKPEEVRGKVAQRLRAAREMAGLSQGQVAEMMDLHRPTISEIEAGRRRVPSEELAEFAKVYRVSTSWLLGEESSGGSEEDPRVLFAARELAGLSEDDLGRLVKVIAAIRRRPGDG